MLCKRGLAVLAGRSTQPQVLGVVWEPTAFDVAEGFVVTSRGGKAREIALSSNSGAVVAGRISTAYRLYVYIYTNFY